jgi:hypothetical protein
MKTILPALFVALALQLSSAFAQQATPTPLPSPSGKTAALAEELLGLMHVDQAMNSAFSQMTKMQGQMMASKGMTPEQQTKQTQVMQAAMDQTKSFCSWDVIKPTFIQIYADVFTEEELQGMIDFFKGPIGQKWIAKQPQLQAETMQKMQAIMMTAMPKIEAAIKQSQETNTPVLPK